MRKWCGGGRELSHTITIFSLTHFCVRKYGDERIGQTRLTNDALIAASAARSGITVITANARDFARLAEFCPLRWEVR
jgi:predicted nucleic acid-binding protein